MIVDVERALCRFIQTRYVSSGTTPFTVVVYPTMRLPSNTKEFIIVNIGMSKQAESISSGNGVWSEVLGKLDIVVVSDRGETSNSYARRQAIIEKLTQVIPNHQVITYNGLKIDLMTSTLTPMFKTDGEFEYDMFSIGFRAQKIEPVPVPVAIT